MFLSPDLQVLFQDLVTKEQPACLDQCTNIVKRSYLLCGSRGVFLMYILIVSKFFYETLNILSSIIY